jgi:DNA excision repair protein ERCC-3
MDAQSIIDQLNAYSKYPLPSNIVKEIQNYILRYGRLKLIREGDDLLLHSDDSMLIEEISRHKRLLPYIITQINQHTLRVDPARRGHIKQALIHIGYPAEDLAGYTDGSPLPLELRSPTLQGKEFTPRAYQQAAVGAFYAGGAPSGGSGIVVLPCGAGKTIVGLTTIAAIQRATLILTPNTVAVRQWIQEILDKTNLPPEMVAEYTGERKEIAPITVTTYQMLTYRQHKGKNDEKDENSEFDPHQYPHFTLFTDYDWGLIIYDEVHLLPAPVFRFTAELQARRRLGLTATLVREDGREADVFSLIGPKKYDVPWRELEHQGWIASAECHEIRVGFANEDDQYAYITADSREQYRIAAENIVKLDVTRHLLARHENDQILIIGQYLDQLKILANELQAPLLTGRTSNAQREKLYEQFRRGEIKRLVVSKVANFAIDLPDANVAIQVSGTFGSRQEEAQRLGRILRPKGDGENIAYFYTIVTRDTRDQDFSANRQLFLTEQGYRYLIEDAEAIFASSAT